MTTFKPLEHSIKKLEALAMDGDKEHFKIESETFFRYMGILSTYRTWMKDKAIELERRYQTKYEQLKIMLEGK